MILVAGGTGRLGNLVVPRLAARRLEVRVLARDPGRRGHVPAGTTDVAIGDVRDRATIERAMEDVTTVLSAVQGFAGPGRVTPASVDRDGNANLVDVAAAAGADIVLMSVVGASPDSPMELFRAKWAAEQHLRGSGARWTIVRATAFVELWAEIMAKPIVFGRGDNPINFVSVHDVAAAVDRAVADVGLRGEVLQIVGPQNVTFNELAAQLDDVRGGGGHTRHVPRWLLRAMAPVARQARAGLCMDTTDMAFDATAAGINRGGLPMTDLRTALVRAVGESVALPASG